MKVGQEGAFSLLPRLRTSSFFNETQLWRGQKTLSFEKARSCCPVPARLLTSSWTWIENQLIQRNHLHSQNLVFSVKWESYLQKLGYREAFCYVKISVQTLTT